MERIEPQPLPGGKPLFETNDPGKATDFTRRLNDLTGKLTPGTPEWERWEKDEADILRGAYASDAATSHLKAAEELQQHQTTFASAIRSAVAFGVRLGMFVAESR